MPQCPVPCFLLFLCFRKVTQEIFSELDETKAKHSEIHRSFQRTEEETEWGHEGAHTTGRRGPGLGPRPLVCVAALGPLLTMPLSPITTPRREKPKDPITFPKYIAIRRRRRPEIGRVQNLFPAPCRRGESPPEVFFIAMLASGAMSE